MVVVTDTDIDRITATEATRMGGKTDGPKALRTKIKVKKKQLN